MAAEENAIRPSVTRVGAYSAGAGEDPCSVGDFYSTWLRSGGNDSGDLQWRRRSMVEMEMEAARVLAEFAQMALLQREGRRRRGGGRRHGWGTTRRDWLPPKKRGKSRSPCGDVGEEDLKDRGSSRIDALSSWHHQCSAAGEDSKCREPSEHMMAMKIESQSISGDKAGSGHFSRQASFCGSRGKQCLTEAEKEAKRLHRVLANRESARQTILRRQAYCEELVKRAAELSLENEKMKMEREIVMKKYLSLRDMNMQLKEQMAKTIKFEIKEDPSVLASIKSELPTSSTMHPSMMVQGSVKSCSSIESVNGSCLSSKRIEDTFQSIVTEKNKDATENVRILMPTQAGIPTLKALQIATGLHSSSQC